MSDDFCANKVLTGCGNSPRVHFVLTTTAPGQRGVDVREFELCFACADKLNGVLP